MRLQELREALQLWKAARHSGIHKMQTKKSPDKSGLFSISKHSVRD